MRIQIQRNYNESIFNKDFYLAAFLVASSMPMRDYSREASVTVFQFSETPELLLLVREFYADNATVSPIRFGNALKNLKSMIRNANTNTNERQPITISASFR